MASEQSSSNQHCCRFLQEDSHLSTNFSSPCQTTKGYKPSDTHLVVGQAATSESYKSLSGFIPKSTMMSKQTATVQVSHSVFEIKVWEQARVRCTEHQTGVACTSSK